MAAQAASQTFQVDMDVSAFVTVSVRVAAQSPEEAEAAVKRLFRRQRIDAAADLLKNLEASDLKDFNGEQATRFPDALLVAGVTVSVSSEDSFEAVNAELVENPTSAEPATP